MSQPISVTESQTLCESPPSSGASNKSCFQFTAVYLPSSVTLVLLLLGFHHGGKVWGLVHRRPHPASTRLQLQGNTLPLPIQLWTVACLRVSGLSARLPEILWVERASYFVHFQGRSWACMIRAWWGGLGFATRARSRAWRRRRRWRGKDGVGRCCPSAWCFQTNSSTFIPASPPRSVFTWEGTGWFRRKQKCNGGCTHWHCKH